MKSYDKPRQHIKKQRHYFADKGLYSQNYGFTSRRKWQPTPVFLPGKFHGWRSLVGDSPWSRKESDTTERLHFHSSLSCIGEGTGNPLQCSCLENPRDGGAWWAAVDGVSQSRTQLKRLGSSSSMGSTYLHSLRWLPGHRRAERSYSTFKVRRGSHEETPLVQGKEQQLSFAGAAMKKYPMSR